MCVLCVRSREKRRDVGEGGFDTQTQHAGEGVEELKEQKVAAMTI